MAIRVIICGEDELFLKMICCEAEMFCENFAFTHSIAKEEITVEKYIFSDFEELSRELNRTKEMSIVFIGDCDCFCKNNVKYFLKFLNQIESNKINTLLYGKNEESNYLKRGKSECLYIRQFFKRPFLAEDFVSVFCGLISSLILPKECKQNDNITVNETSRTVCFGQACVKLTKREFSLFSYLSENKNTVVSRQQLKENVWNNSELKDANVTDVYISYLRQKLISLTGTDLIKSIRGEGYLYEEKWK